MVAGFIPIFQKKKKYYNTHKRVDIYKYFNNLNIIFKLESVRKISSYILCRILTHLLCNVLFYNTSVLYLYGIKTYFFVTVIYANYLDAQNLAQNITLART